MELQSVLKQISAQLISQSIRNPVLNLELESILKAKVVDLPAPSIVTLLIQGKQVTAKMDSPVEKGQWLNLKVAGTDDNGMLCLKRVETSDQTVSKGIQTDRLSEQLSREITSSYRELQLPVPNDKVEKLIELFKNWPESSRFLRSAMVTAELGLPLTPDIVTKVYKALHESFSMHLDAARSELEAKGLAASTNSIHSTGLNAASGMTSTSGMTSATGLTATAVSLNSSASTNSAVSANSGAENHESSTHLIDPSDQSGSKLDGQKGSDDSVHQLSSKSIQNPTVVPLQASIGNQTAESLDRLQTAFQRASESLFANSQDKGTALQQAVESLGLQYEISAGKLIAKGAVGLEGMSQLTDTLKAVLLKEINSHTLPNEIALQGLDRSTAAIQMELQSQPSNDLSDTAWAKLNELMDHVTGQQLLSGFKSDSPQFAYQHFAIPLHLPSGTADAQVQIVARRNASRKLDPANCTLLFQLDLPQLGKTDIWVHVIDKRVSIRFITAPDVHLHVDPQDLTDLRQQMKHFGYQLGTVKEEERTKNTFDLEGILLKEIQAGKTSIDLKM